MTPNSPSGRQRASDGERPLEIPTYPYARLEKLASEASDFPGGLVDLSVGTPCDPPPSSVVKALGSSGAERGYPASQGSVALRHAASNWISRRFGCEVDPGQIGACVGTKELVAGLPYLLRLRSPLRRTVLGPKIAYPTYEMGAFMARCRYVEVPLREDGRLDLSLVGGSDVDDALMLWLNSPANPTGDLVDLESAVTWARDRDIPVFSDECYCEFTWPPAKPESVLQHGTGGVVAVHSLSKRSNLAGLRVGFIAGDKDLVGFLTEVRRHSGLMVAGPVQAAAAVALDDDVHVAEQRNRYLSRLVVLTEAFGGCGLPASLPAGGFYLWIRGPDWARDIASAQNCSTGWVIAECLARTAGILVSPGEFYGEAGTDFVRVAAVAPDDAIEMVAKRLSALEGKDLHLASSDAATAN